MAELSVMDRINMILSDPEKATMTLAQIVSEEIREFKASPEYAIMLEAESYYRNRSDVQRKTVDVANRSNTKIEHPILKKLVDQKANYLLSKPWTVDTKNSAYGEALTKVFDQTFRRKIKSLGKGAIKSGIAWIQPYFRDGKLAFMRIPSTELVPLWRDAERTELDAFIRFYDQVIYIGTRKHIITHAEFWWPGGVKWFKTDAFAGTGAGNFYVDKEHGDEASDYYGVRPALYLESGNLVSDSTDTDGAYILQWNQPPSDPSSISYGTPQAGNSLVLSTGGSTDPEGDAISYVWERKIDSGAYVQLGITTAKTFTDTVPTSGTTYTARVKAVDANGLESGYCTGSAKTISYNTPPMISGSDQNLGAKTAPFTYQYTVTDAQAATQTITVTEKLTNGTQTITLRTYTATSGAQNTVNLSSVWLPLLSGTHVLTITATDSAGGSATRKITFSRTVSRIAAARAFNTDALVQKVFVSLYPATIPADATLHLEVTNNPFDTSPVWVDITDKANRLVHVFTNTTAAKGYGLGYRFYITKGTQEIEITQATIRFA